MPKNIWDKWEYGHGKIKYRPSEELNHALEPGNEEQFLKLLKEIDVDKEKNDLLYEASRRGNEKIVSMLLEAGANPNPILRAQAKGRIAFNQMITPLLVNAKADRTENLLGIVIYSCHYKRIPKGKFSLMNMLLDQSFTIHHPSDFFHKLQDFDQRDPHVLILLQQFCVRLQKDPAIKNTVSDTYKVFSEANSYLVKLQRLTDICEESSTPLDFFIDTSFKSKVTGFFNENNDFLTPVKVDALLKRFTKAQHETAGIKEKLIYKM